MCRRAASVPARSPPWHSVGVFFAAPDDPRPWDEIPFVPLVGIVIGLIIVWGAIRYMFRKK